MSNHHVVLANLLKLKFDDRRLMGAEIGVYYGKTSEHLLKELQIEKLYCVDPWTPYESFDHISKNGREAWKQIERAARARLKPFAGICEIYDMESAVASLYVREQTLDFVFVDGNHSFAYTLVDCCLWWHRLKPDGLLCCHDYGRYKETTAAYDFFGKIMNREMFKYGSQVIVFEK